MKLERVVFSAPVPMPGGGPMNRTVGFLQTTEPGRPTYVPELVLDGETVIAGRDIYGPGSWRHVYQAESERAVMPTSTVTITAKPKPVKKARSRAKK